jgi:hypothetical protein
MQRRLLLLATVVEEVVMVQSAFRIDVTSPSVEA